MLFLAEHTVVQNDGMRRVIKPGPTPDLTGMKSMKPYFEPVSASCRLTFDNLCEDACNGLFWCLRPPSSHTTKVARRQHQAFAHSKSCPQGAPSSLPCALDSFISASQQQREPVTGQQESHQRKAGHQLTH